MEHHKFLVHYLKRHLLVCRKRKFLSERYDWNCLKTILSIHAIHKSIKSTQSIFCKNIMWSNLSSAFCRSTWFIPVGKKSSIPIKMKSVSCVRQEYVENFAQKPDWYLYKLFSSNYSCIWMWMVLSIILDTRGTSEMGQ